MEDLVTAVIAEVFNMLSFGLNCSGGSRGAFEIDLNPGSKNTLIEQSDRDSLIEQLDRDTLITVVLLEIMQ